MGRDRRHLERVLEEVLSAAGVVAHATDEAGESRMEVRDPDGIGGFQSLLLDQAVDLLGDLLDDFLDSRRVNSSVLDQRFERASCNFAPDRIERADHDDPGRVVDDHVHACRLFERADVAPLATDHASLDVIGGDVHRADRARGSMLGGESLDGGDGDFAGLVLGVIFGLADDALAGAQVVEPGRVDIVNPLVDGVADETDGPLFVHRFDQESAPRG